MSVTSRIQDCENNLTVNVDRRDGRNRLHVLTEQYKELANRSKFFSHPDLGINMNVDGSITSAADEGVHNGTDSMWWTATAISGTWDFSSTNQAYAGTYSIDATGTQNDDTAQFENDEFLGSSTFNTLSGWIYITSWSDVGTKEVQVYAWNTNTGEVTSDIYNIGNYVNTGNQDVWQQFIIPFNFTNEYDALRVTTVSTGGGNAPNYYLDEIMLQDTSSGGGPYTFDVSPGFGYWWHVTGLGIAVAAPYVSTLADSSMPNIPYNGFLGVSLPNGFVYQRTTEGEIAFSSSINHLIEMINQYNAVISSYGGTSNHTWIKIDFNFREPYVLKSENEDSISITINDDLSSLEYFRVVAGIGEEDRRAIYT